MKKRLFFCIVLIFIFYTKSTSQKLEFELINAIKTKEIILDREIKNELINEIDILPNGKSYLIVTAVITNKNESTINLDKDDISIGTDKKNKVLGYLYPTGRARMRWGFNGDIYNGLNYFTGIFIVDSNIEKTKVNLGKQSFKISYIKESIHSIGCLPNVIVNNKEYLSEISYQEKYRNSNNQVYTKKLALKEGKFLKLSLSIEFCNDPKFYKRKSFHFLPSFFQIENSNGFLYNCVGSFSNGQLFENSTQNILGMDSISTELALIFIVSEEDDFSLKYMNQEIK